MSHTVKAYLAYKQKRADLRRAHKLALEEELIPWKRDLGLAIVEDRKVMHLNDISAMIGNGNRNFLYEMERYAVSDSDKITVKVDTPDRVTHQDWEILDYNPLFAEVRVYDIPYRLSRDSVDDKFVAPDVWADGSVTNEQRKTYREVLRAVNDN